VIWVVWFGCSVGGIVVMLTSRPAQDRRYRGLTDEIVNQPTLTDDILNGREDTDR
jgi:hypothetical protein